jgi:hypothetical protein
MIIKFITGTEPLSNLDTYFANMQSFGVARACELREAALARFNNR